MADVSKAVLITGLLDGHRSRDRERLAGAGHTVYATARRLESIADLEPRGCRLLACDVNDEASMAAAVRAVEEAEGAVGVLVNNAGYSQSGAVETVPMDQVRQQFETNVFGLVRMCQLVLPGMRRQGWGRIVNISSMGGKLTFPGGGLYHATKYAVEAISDALRFEVAGFGVEVVIDRAGPDPHRVRATTAVGAIGEARRGEDDVGSLREVQPRGGQGDRGDLQRPAGQAGRRPRGRRRDDREGDRGRPPRTALPRHAVGPAR